MRDWYERAKPDAIIVESQWRATQIAERLHVEIPGPIAFAAASRQDAISDAILGIDELPRAVGSSE